MHDALLQLSYGKVNGNGAMIVSPSNSVVIPAAL
jgi:hypothetical protein